MKYNYLGTTGLRVSELALGTMLFGRPLSSSVSMEAMMHACNMGINLVDTADVYNDGQAEDILGAYWGGSPHTRHEWILSTKGGCVTDEHEPNSGGWNEKHLTHALECSLRRLKTEYIDIYHIHMWDPHGNMESLRAWMSQQVAAGKVRCFGVSNWPAWGVARMKQLYPALLTHQVHYSLANRDVEHDILRQAIYDDMAVLVWSPLSAGYLAFDDLQGTRRKALDFPPMTMDLDQEVALRAAVRSIAHIHGIAPARISLAWVTQREGITSTILGFRDMVQFKQLLAHGHHEPLLTVDEMQMLGDLSCPRPALMYPEWMALHQNRKRMP